MPMRALLAGLALALVCRTGALAVCGDGIVDPDEVCDGDCCAADCQSFLPPGSICRPMAGPCDVAESCDGTTSTCPPDAKSTAECRPAVDVCDVAESCDGVNDDCPPDAFVTADTPCRPSAGQCDVAEACTGTDPACPPDAKSTAVCRSAAGVCDLAESCDGVNDDCPPDDFVPAETPCRASAGECDIVEACTGTGADCPLDAKSTAECRPAVDVCDAPEFCNGVDDACPPDTFAPPTQPCRPAVGNCDVQENCTGTGPDCPADVKSTAVCRPAVDVCDLAESCDGLDDFCPPDAFAPPTVICRVPVDQCDAAEFCTGSTASCPADVPVPNDTACDDGNACTRVDRCESGVCTGSSPVLCSPLDVCHVAGTCNPANGTCSNPAKPDNVPCDDGRRCTTADSCQAGVCSGLRIAGCCESDADCDDRLACTDDRCVANACTHAPVDDRCGGSADCNVLMCMPADPAADASGCVARATDEGSYCTEDENPCTIDACRSGICRHESDGTGTRCATLFQPYRTTVGLLARTRELASALRAAIAAACTKVGAACDVEPSPNTDRLVALLGMTEDDLGTAALALAGRLADSSSPTAPRDPDMRARLALGFASGAPGQLRAFLATLAQARAQHTIGSAYARARRVEARRLLTGTTKLRRQLLRVIARHQTFAR